MNRQAVVVWLESNGLGVVRSLGRAGVPVLGLTSDPKQPTAQSRYRRVAAAPDERSEAIVDRLIELAGGAQPPRPLFLTMERTVQIVSEHRERLAPHYLFNLPERDLLRRLNDKASFSRLAADAGLLVPPTGTAQSIEELIAAADRVGFPLIVKPLEKGGPFDGHFQARALRIEGTLELERRFEGFLWGQPLLVQRVIEGADAEIYFCLTSFNCQGESVAHFTGRKLRIWPRGWGNTASALAAEEPEVTDATLALFRSVGFRGLGSLELKRERTSGLLYVIEPTVGRTDYQSEVAPANGVNIPYAAYLDLLGLPVQEMRLASVPVLWIDRVNDMRSAAAAIAAGELDRSECRDSLARRQADSLYATDDPGPYVFGRYRAVIARGKLVALRLLDRFPWLYLYFRRAIPPDIRWPPQEIMDSLRRHKLPRKSFVEYFTRGPERQVPNEPRIAVLPADGVVRNVLERDGHKVIDISMDFYDVDVQRVPIDGIVVAVEESGRQVERGSEDERRCFVDPWEYEGDYLFPVQRVVRLDTAIGDVVVRQISSILARRIETFVKPGERVRAGQRLGHIFLGSTIVPELPPIARVLVEPQLQGRRRRRTDKAIQGGKTIMARY